MKRINEALRRILDGVDHVDEYPAPGTTAEPATATAPPEHDENDEFVEPAPRAKRSWWERDWGRPRWSPDGERSPQTIRHTVELNLEDVVFGCRHDVQGRIVDLCAACAGVGRLVSTQTPCQTCSGEGRQQVAGRWRKCAACHGDGADRKDCAECHAGGRAATSRSYHFEVRVPPGLRDGQIIMLRGQGQRGASEPGDIEVQVRVRPHELFSVDAEQRLCCTVPTDLYSATATGTVVVPLLDGSTSTLSLAHGLVQMLAGEGLPNRDGARGPLVVTLKVVTPARHSAEQRALLKKLADDLKRGGYAHCPDLADWHQRVQAAQDRTGGRRPSD
jgi:molecular chaperone DnaJ